MAEIIWSAPAMNDLEIIHDFISRESPKFAQKKLKAFSKELGC